MVECMKLGTITLLWIFIILWILRMLTRRLLGILRSWRWGTPIRCESYSTCDNAAVVWVLRLIFSGFIVSVNDEFFSFWAFFFFLGWDKCVRVRLNGLDFAKSILWDIVPAEFVAQWCFKWVAPVYQPFSSYLLTLGYHIGPFVHVRQKIFTPLWWIEVLNGILCDTMVLGCTWFSEVVTDGGIGCRVATFEGEYTSIFKASMRRYSLCTWEYIF